MATAQHAITDPEYEATPTKRRARRTKVAIKALEDALVAIVKEHAPLTCRHVFYLAMAVALITKSEKEYKYTIGRLLLRLRREGRISYRDIADESRWVRRVETSRGARQALKACARFYRRDLLHDQRLHLELWVEKAALVGVIEDVCDEFAVPLYPTSGFASETFIYEAALEIAHAIKEDGHRAVIYTLGDHDPSGMHITRDLERRLRRLVEEVSNERLDFEVRRLALTPEQVRRYRLPTRPTKREKNNHAKRFRFARSVELDALPPETLRGIVRDAIEREIDPQRLARTKRVEAAERETLERVLGGLQ